MVQLLVRALQSLLIQSEEALMFVVRLCLLLFLQLPNGQDNLYLARSSNFNQESLPYW